MLDCDKMEFYSTSFEPKNRFLRYDMLNEQYFGTHGTQTFMKYEPHKSIPIQKLKMKMMKKDDFIFELIYKFEKKNKIIREDGEDKVIQLGEINKEISDYLQNVFIRAIWMMNRSIGGLFTNHIESINYSIRESMIVLLGDIINFDEDCDDYYLIIHNIMCKTYTIDENIIDHLKIKYSQSRFRPFIQHINTYIKTHLVE